MAMNGKSECNGEAGRKRKKWVVAKYICIEIGKGRRERKFRENKQITGG